MVSNNFTSFAGKILIELAADLLYFPLWWYSRGLFNLLESQLAFLRNREKALALSVWVKNIFKPMFGQNDWQGILISVVMRIFQIIFRSFIMLFWFIFACSIVLLWIFLPVLVFYEIIFQLFI